MTDTILKIVLTLAALSVPVVTWWLSKGRRNKRRMEELDDYVEDVTRMDDDSLVEEMKGKGRR